MFYPIILDIFEFCYYHLKNEMYYIILLFGNIYIS